MLVYLEGLFALSCHSGKPFKQAQPLCCSSNGQENVLVPGESALYSSVAVMSTVSGAGKLRAVRGC